MTIVEDIDFLICEPFDEYRAKSQKYLSSHQLADFRKCPLLYHRKRLGLIPDEDRPAYLVGRAAHTLILEGRRRFGEEYAVGGPINSKTSTVYGSNTKAFAGPPFGRCPAKAQGKPVLTREQSDLCLRMHLGVSRNQKAVELFADGVAEAVVRAEYCNVDCQIRMDWLDLHRAIVDLKTCDDLTWFEADARRFGYAHQLAFYRAVLAQHVGELKPVYLIGVEKREPHRCGVWKIDPDTLDSAQRENEAAIERLKKCEATDTWPTGYEEIRVFEHI